MSKTFGIVGTIMSALTLSLELCFLKVMQFFDFLSNGVFYSEVWRYAGVFPCNLALLLTLLVLVASIASLLGAHETVLRYVHKLIKI